MNTNQTAAGVQTHDYGIDAPGVRKGMLIAGGAGLMLAVVTFIAGRNGAGLPERVAAVVGGPGLFAAVYGFFMGGYMTYGSRVGKLYARERLLNIAAELRPWQGNEHVLDVGCGRGLMMVGAAKRLTTGQAVGIDLWRGQDQANNSPEAARENARSEGVADRVRIDTGNACELPYPDASFDLVLSHWVVHNLDEAADRKRIGRDVASAASRRRPGACRYSGN